MSLDDLESDLARNADAIDNVVFASFDDVKAYLKQTMYPLMSNVVDELVQIDDELAEYTQGQSDMLTPETAGIFAAVITHCMQLVRALRKIRPNDTKIAAQLESITRVCQHAQGVLLEITVVPDPDEANPPDAPDAHGAPPVEPANDQEVLDGNA